MYHGCEEKEAGAIPTGLAILLSDNSLPGEKVRYRDPQSVGNSMDVEQTDIALAALNAADIRTMEIAFFSKPFLTPAAGFS